MKKSKRDQRSQDEWCHRTQGKNIFETLSGLKYQILGKAHKREVVLTTRISQMIIAQVRCPESRVRSSQMVVS